MEATSRHDHIAVDWDVKHQFKQTNKHFFLTYEHANGVGSDQTVLDRNFRTVCSKFVVSSV